MKERAKKVLKGIGIVAGAFVAIGVGTLAYIGGGELCRELYYDALGDTKMYPDVAKRVIQSASFGYDRLLNLDIYQ